MHDRDEKGSATATIQAAADATKVKTVHPRALRLARDAVIATEPANPKKTTHKRLAKLGL